MASRGFQFFLEKSIRQRKVNFFIRHVGGGDGKEYVALPLTMTENDPASPAPIDPTFSLSFDEARALMDELWGAGIRPSHGDGNTGQLAATQAHLSDMRELAAKLLAKVLG